MDKTTAKNAATASKTITLTKREQEIYTILLEGASPKDISFSLKIKPETVYFHQKNIFFKLNVENINEF
ncbi:MAG: helix-turn-helix transcriptional regulator, partial [Treponema sp.]|nr:helix-turn-helix transcriptional regulator [Treponema sp.]